MAMRIDREIDAGTRERKRPARQKQKASIARPPRAHQTLRTRTCRSRTIHGSGVVQEHQEVPAEQDCRDAAVPIWRIGPCPSRSASARNARRGRERRMPK